MLLGRSATLTVLSLVLVISVLINVSSNVTYFHIISSLHELQSELRELQHGNNRGGFLPPRDATRTNDPQVGARVKELETKVRELERIKNDLQLQVNSWMSWNSDPYLGSNQNPALCKNQTDLTEYQCDEGKGGCPGFYDHPICLDAFPPKDRRDCIVYDFGIRANPHFGAALVKPPFNCKVFAFDPSPITKKWYKSDRVDAFELRNNPNYRLFHYGAGGVDGDVRLNEYNWGQVSIVRIPMTIDRDCSANATGPCVVKRPTLGKFYLPVRTLGSIMRELGHDHVDILKLDVEGSEYMFLENALETGSMEKVNQLTIEWHHFDFDSRYGGGSTPPINTIVAFLNRIGLQQFYQPDENGGWPADDRDFWERGVTLRYQLGSFLRVGAPPSSSSVA